MKYFYYITIIATALLTWSCKKVVFNCDYTIKMYQITGVSTENGKPPTTPITTVLTDAIAYGFYADTANWAVTSYENALVGVLSNRKNSETKQADITVSPDATGVATMVEVSGKPFFIVVCDKSERYYAWMVAEVEADLKNVVVPIRFETWRREESYKQGRWNIIDQFLSERPVIVPPPDPDPTPDPDPDPTPDPQP